MTTNDQSADANNPLVGKWFHSFNDDGHTKWQGQIVGVPFEGHYLIQLYEWVSGGEDTQRVIPMTDVVGWSFYDSSEVMNSHYREELSPRNKEIRLKKKEEVKRVRCPLPAHPDNNPSAWFNTYKGVYYCPVCNLGGEYNPDMVDSGGKFK